MSQQADGPARRRGLLRRLPWKWRWAIVLTTFALIGSAGVIAAALVHYTIKFPDPMALRRDTPSPAIRVLARDGSVLSERGQAHEFVPLDLLPRHVIDAVVATEDRRFFEHNGLDPLGLLRAAFANLRAGRYVQGGSTLSQQLAKNLFLSSERTIERKLEELLIAIWLEVRLSKSDILELYLNRVYFGGGAYGIDAAARRYFDKPAAQLKLSEAAVLAGLLKAPSKFSPNANPGLARSRARLVLKRMHAAGYIGEEAEAAAARDSVRFTDPTAGRDNSGLEYAMDFVLERLPPLAGGGHREIIVETTIDSVLQKRAQSAVEAALAADGTKLSAGQAAVVVLDRDGGIRAMIGGRSWTQSQFNRAVKARRQPGSAFKPLVYLAAIERGATADTQVVDEPITIGGWSPRNEDGRHRGAMSLRQALAQSVNTVVVRLQQDAGTARVIGLARRLGIRSELRPDLSLALGTSEVSLLELSGAYAVLASGGLGVEPHMIRRVRTASSVLYQRPQTKPRMAIAPDHVGTISSMLNTVMVSGTGRRAALARHAAAGKTGTSQDHRDAWFIGYTAHLTTGVWVGNDNGEPMSRVMGSGIPATIWKGVMQAAHDGLPPEALPGVTITLPGAASGQSPANVQPSALNPGQFGLPWAGQPAPTRRENQFGQSPIGSPAKVNEAAPTLAPRQPIDRSLFEQALRSDPVHEVRSNPAALDLGRFGRTLESWSLPGMMGLGVKPTRAQGEAQPSAP